VQADLGDLDLLGPNADGRRVDRPGPPIGADDVLAVHEFLRDFDGDFAALFARVRGRARGPDDG
jgi:hypothetical protein